MSRPYNICKFSLTAPAKTKLQLGDHFALHNLITGFLQEKTKFSTAFCPAFFSLPWPTLSFWGCTEDPDRHYTFPRDWVQLDPQWLSGTFWKPVLVQGKLSDRLGK